MDKMKNQLMLALSLATIAAVSAPLSAQGSNGKNRSGGVYDRNGDGVIDSRDQVGTNCRWYDVNCNITNGRTGSTTADGSWQVVGRDQNGSTIYQRRRVDGNGNVIVDRARRDSYGRFIIIGSQVVNQNSRRNNVVYGANGENCNYKQNKNGYSTKCKYNKVKGNRQDNDGDQNDRYNSSGTYNNRSGPSYDVGAGNGKGNGKNKHGEND
jgi:hypothetical protein